MQPPIKRATLNADTLFQGRGTSNGIPLWKSVPGKKTSERAADIRSLFSAKSEIALLDLLKQFPGQSGKFYARRLPGRSPEWVRVTLHQYAADGLVRYARIDKVTYIWFLNE